MLNFRNLLTYIICILGNTSVKSSPDNSVIHIVIFHEELRSQVSVDAAIEYMKQNYSGGNFTVGNVTKISTASETPIDLITKICGVLDKLNEGTSRPDLALDFTRAGISSEAVKLLTKVLRIPTVSASFGQKNSIKEWKNISSDMERYLVQVSPPADILVESFRGFALYQNMSTAVFLHDGQFEMHHKYTTLADGIPVKHIIRELTPGDLELQMQRLLKLEMANFFIAATSETVSRVLAVASSLLKNRSPGKKANTRWYSMSLDDQYPNCKQCETSMKVFHLTPKFPSQEISWKRLSFMKTARVTTNDLSHRFYFDLTVDAITAVRSIKSQGNWKESSVIYCNSYNLSEVATLDTGSIDLLTAFKEAQKENLLGPFNLEGNGLNYPVFDMKIENLEFAAGAYEPFSKPFIAEWKSGFGGVDQFWPKTQNQLADMQSPETKNIIVTLQPPFMYVNEACSRKEREEVNTKCYYGYSMELLLRIREEIPFSYKVRESPSQGYLKENGEWEESMVKELMEKRADIGLGAFVYMPEREEVIDVTIPIYDLTGFIVVMRVDRTRYDLFKFLSVLESDVWWCIIAAFFFTSAIMWFFERFSPYSYRNNKTRYEDDEEKREFSIRECMWFCMTSLTPQGGGEAPKNLSGRLVAATWWLFGFIIIASYTANLAAFLTVSRLEKPITTFQQLIGQYRVHYSPVKYTPAWRYFDRMAFIEHKFYEAWKEISLNDSLSDYDRSLLAVWQYPVSDKFTKIWQAMQENKPPLTMEEAIIRIKGNETKTNKTDAFALIAETTDARYIVLMNCELKTVGNQFAMKPYVIGVQKHSPLKESFSKVIAKLERRRYFDWLKNKWWHRNIHRPFCPKIDKIEEGISAQDIGGVFILVATGIGVAWGFVFLECTYYKISRIRIAKKMKEVEITTTGPSNPTSATMRADFASEFSPPVSQTVTNYKTEYNKLPSVQASW